MTSKMTERTEILTNSLNSLDRKRVSISKNHVERGRGGGGEEMQL